MKSLRQYIRYLLKEVVQISTPEFGERAVHKVEEKVTKDMLEDIIAVLPIWEAGEHEQAEELMKSMHFIGTNQLHNLMNAAEEMKNYGQIRDDVPEWVTNYFAEKFSGGW